jgi:endonuclease YncB( thermonuclease family)
MSYRLIKGKFELRYYRNNRWWGSRPDGDSVWFKPDHPRFLQDLGGRDADFNPGGFAQLRFEGIDALELHYPGSDHQHAEQAVAARDFLLKDLLGFRDLVYAPTDDIDTYVRSYTPESIRGYILCRSIGPYRRPIAFVFKGNTGWTDGDDDVFLTVNRMDESLNAKLMRQGYCYPTYYGRRDGEGGLPWQLRERLTQLADQAYYSDKGVWAVDKSCSNPRIRNKDELMELAIWPKLYRRLANYFRSGRRRGLSGFEGWLQEEPRDRDDRVWVIPRSEEVALHDVVKVQGNRINMLYWPEELIIIPR